jgi:thymidylate synthase (FAD)
MGTQIEMLSTVQVKLIDYMASDLAVTRAAQVSVKGENNPDTDMPRLINYLMESRHGSPFEHAVFTWFIEAPIFVFREFHRHRIASYNEMSGRYTKLKPRFYTPTQDRPLRNIGTSARPEFRPGTPEQQALVAEGDRETCQAAWDRYEARIDAGVANEVARTILPLSIYSQMYCTMNARALMNFLSLRVDSPEATFRTRPQLEIQFVATKMEIGFATIMPHTWEAFTKHGRVAP